MPVVIAAQLQSGGDMVELAVGLRFYISEAAEFLSRILGLRVEVHGPRYPRPIVFWLVWPACQPRPETETDPRQGPRAFYILFTF